MSIRRAPRPESNFYLLDKAISEDNRLTWEARGLLIFLLGKPDHWEVSVRHLSSLTTGTRKKSGRDSVRAMIGELETVGYITREPARSAGGTIIGVNHIVHEEPRPQGDDQNDTDPQQPGPDKPGLVDGGSDKPGPDKPGPDKPGPVNPPQVSIEVKGSIEGAVRTDVEQGAAGATPPPPADDDQLPVTLDQPAGNDPHGDMPGPKDPNAKTYHAWASYAWAYRDRYGVWPLWNGKTAGMVGQLVARVGKENAPGVAAYYVTLNNQFYVAKGHPIGPLLADCETIYTQWVTGQQMTASRARQVDSTQSNASNATAAKAMLANWED